jgi:hypothetical protein
MRAKNIRALPVTRTEGGRKSYTGIISSFDLTAFVGFASYFRFELSVCVCVCVLLLLMMMTCAAT